MRQRIAVVGLLFALPAAATVVIAQSYEELAKTSPLVVRASVGQVQSWWDERHTTIETWSEVQLTDVLKGRLPRGAILMVRTPGGEVGNLGAHVSGAPKLVPGEDVLLFLEPAADDPKVWLVSGMAAGKVSFTRNPLGELRAVRDVRGLAFYDHSAGAAKYQVIDRPEDLGTPDAFLSRIRRAVSR